MFTSTKYTYGYFNWPGYEEHDDRKTKYVIKNETKRLKFYLRSNEYNLNSLISHDWIKVLNDVIIEELYFIYPYELNLKYVKIFCKELFYQKHSISNNIIKNFSLECKLKSVEKGISYYVFIIKIKPLNK